MSMTLMDDTFEEDTMGMTVSSGSVKIAKDDTNLIGISIGGGAPLCPCVYVVQVFDNTPASRDGTLESGDELVAVQGQSVKGKGKTDVARMIQATKGEVTIHYNKLHADPKRGKDLDLILKKLKHQIVENMSSSTADALGLSRAILCNDSLVKKLQELERTEQMYKGLVEHTRGVLRGTFDLLLLCREIGDVFCNIGVREPQKSAHEAFCKFGEYHRQMEKRGIKMLKSTKPILQDLGTYLTKAIPDTKLTIKKYADVKFEYLSYCLKVKELDDEDAAYLALGEPLYRVETGNYEYRLVLRCRSHAKQKFARLRSDVLTKLELLDAKHVQDIVYQLKRLMAGLSLFHRECQEIMAGDPKLFPVEVDLNQSTCRPKEVEFDQDGYDQDEEPVALEEKPDPYPVQQYQEEALIDCSPTDAKEAEPSTGNLLITEPPATDNLMPADPPVTGNLLSNVSDATGNLLTASQPPTGNLISADPSPTGNLLPTDQPVTGNLLSTDPPGGGDLLGGGTGYFNYGNCMEKPSAAAATPAEPKSSSDNWNENWLLGPNKEENVPKNIEPGGDIDLLLLDN